MLERNKDICIDVLNGSTLEKVAAKHGITRERVRQILGKRIRRACPDYWEDCWLGDERHGVFTYRRDKDILIPLIEKYAHTSPT